MSTKMRDEVFSGISWSFISKVFWQITKAVTGIILTRLLDPNQFGLFAMLLTVTAFTQLVGEFGFTKIIVQRNNVSKDYFSSVFWFNLGVGTSLTLVVFLISPIISRFYSEDVLINLLRVISLDFILYSFSIVQIGILTREMKFNKLAIVDIVSVLISGLFGISLAYFGAGIWSLIIQTLSFTTSRVIILWIVSSWKPSWSFDWSHIREDLKFGGSLLGANLLNQVTRNIDYILIGYFYATAELGIYNRAYSLSMIPVAIVVQVVSKVVFPAFSKIQDDNSRIRKAFLRIIKMVGFFVFPTMLGIIMVADDAILLLFGSKWIDMIPVLRVLSVTALIQSISKLDGNLYYPKGRADIQLKVGLFTKSLEIIGIIVGLRWGILGVATGYTIGVMLGVYPNYFFAGRLINLRFQKIMHAILPELLISIAMATVIGVVSFTWNDFANGWLGLFLKVSIGGVVYLGLALIFKLAPLTELNDIYLEIKNKL